MNALTKITVLSFLVGLYVGCSPVKFGLDGSKCKDSGCIVENGKFAFNYSVTAGYGKVDILIVNDNSASMSFEQARMAPRFANFISDLDQRNIDYRIAMTTTDIQETGSLKGGTLIPFASGVSYITPQMANRISLFNGAIQRPETLQCEKFVANWIRNNGGKTSSINTTAYMNAYALNCPSGDERGIYSANLVVQSNPGDFIRNDAHLSVIFLSDEDERSGLYKTDSNYSLAALDQPSSLIDSVRQKFGDTKYGSLTVHAIVVKDGACLTQQNSQELDNYAPTRGLVTGSIGTAYLSFINSGWGRSADICSSNYTSQLGEIRSNITDKIKDIVLNCQNPGDLIVTVSGSPVSHRVEGKTLIFSSVLSPGTSVSLSYTCTSLN